MIGLSVCLTHLYLGCGVIAVRASWLLGLGLGFRLSQGQRDDGPAELAQIRRITANPSDGDVPFLSAIAATPFLITSISS